MKKRFCCGTLVLCGILLFSLLGCNKKAPATGGTGSSGKPYEGVTLTLSLCQPADILHDQFEVWYDHLKQRARDELGITLNIEMVSWADYLNKHLMSVATGEGPDIIQLGSATPSVVAAADGLLNLRPYMDKFTGGFDVYFDVGKYYAQYNGEIIALPWGGGGRVIYYNKKYYDEAGLTYPKNDWSWDDFTHDMEILTKYLGRPCYAFPGVGNETTFNFWANLVTDGGTILSPDNKTATFNSDAGVSSIRKLIDLYDKGIVIPSFAESGLDEFLVAFTNGDLAVSYGSASWWIELVRRMGEDAFGTVTMPVGKTGLTTGAPTMSEFGIMKYTKNPDAAVAFLAILAGPEETLTANVIQGWVPFRYDLKDSPEFTKYKFYETFFLNAEKSRLYIPQIANVNTVLASSTKMLNAMYGQMISGYKFTDEEIKTRLDGLAVEVNSILK